MVGPNGSGKSNVVDAIRWVLGEQKSSQLRLDKMTSVIFNGTKKRKEGQMAQVTLAFDNTKNILPTDYNTVSITRILYRSGESEYRLNGVTCRLKDITSLFLDTGIGADSYAIIALNMVEDLLSDREAARRKMFEQAAGVSKYKARKHETQLKLEACRRPRPRGRPVVRDRGPVEKTRKQAERAQKYYSLKDEYKKLSIELAVHNLSRHKKPSKISNPRSHARKTTTALHEAQARLLEADIEAKRKNHTDKETSLSEQQQEVNRLTGRIRGKENEKGMLEQKFSFVQNDIRRLEDQIAQNNSHFQALGNEVEGYQTDLNHERNVEAELEQALVQAQKLLETVRSDHNLLKGNLDEFVKEQQVLEREVVELEKQKAIQTNQIENLRRDVERTLSDIAARREEMKVLEGNIAELTKTEQAQQKKISALEAGENKRKSDIAEAEKQQEALLKNLADHNRQLDARRNEYKLTKSMVESLEGFPESIKFLSQQKEWAKNCPLLSDLIYVREEYRVVIENYLEQYLNYYVVPNADEAVKAIALLGQSQKGRANFFCWTPSGITSRPSRFCRGASAPWNWWKWNRSTGRWWNSCWKMCSSPTKRTRPPKFPTPRWCSCRNRAPTFAGNSA